MNNTVRNATAKTAAIALPANQNFMEVYTMKTNRISRLFKAAAGLIGTTALITTMIILQSSMSISHGISLGANISIACPQESDSANVLNTSSYIAEETAHITLENAFTVLSDGAYFEEEASITDASTTMENDGFTLLGEGAYFEFVIF